MRLKLLVIAALLIVGGGFVAVSLGLLGAPATTATTLLTTAATVTDVTDEVAATGTVQAVHRYSLAFGRGPAVSAGDSTDSSSDASSSGGTGVAWPVTDVAVAVGDRVTAGQVLATAAVSDLDAQIADAERSSKAAALQLKLATSDYDNASTTATRRQALIQLYNAQSANAKAAATLADLKAMRASATITAPVAGVVTAIAISEGADAPTGSAITMLSADLQVVTSVVESDITSISVGQAASVTVAALDATLRGTVSAIEPAAASGSGSGSVVSFSVAVALDAPPSALRPGMSADISITAASATNVVAIPSRALSGTAPNYTVRVVGADGTVTTRQVQVGLVTSSLAEIRSGLETGERVVTGTSSSQTNGVNSAVGGGAFPGGGIIRDGNVRVQTP